SLSKWNPENLWFGFLSEWDARGVGCGCPRDDVQLIIGDGGGGLTVFQRRARVDHAHLLYGCSIAAERNAHHASQIRRALDTDQIAAIVGEAIDAVDARVLGNSKALDLPRARIN